MSLPDGTYQLELYQNTGLSRRLVTDDDMLNLAGIAKGAS